MPTTTCPNCGRIIPLEMEELSIWIQCAKCDLEFVPTTGEMRSRPSKASTPVSPSRENTRGDQWYYGRGGKQYGPVSAAELKQMASGGHLSPTDMVRKEGMP